MNDHRTPSLARAGTGTNTAAGLYDALVEKLRQQGTGDAAPRVGQPFPDFVLPDAWGQLRSLDALLARGPLVLSFNRGGWCPHCAYELRAWGNHHDALREAGGSLAVITPEVGGRATMLERLVGKDADLLCDVDLGLALSLGLAFYIGAPVQQRYREIGLDLAEIYGSDSGFLPVPATFVLDHAGVVRFAHCNPDFRIRAEPVDVIAIVRDIALSS